jgi:prepilin-type N-terminal cleavage/methylation domain-containing protein
LAHVKAFRGFTLSELLICILILGEISTFAIPKILSAQQNKRFNAVGKETAAMVTQAYQQLQLNNAATSSTTVGDLTQYMSYVSFDTGGVNKVDDVPSYGSMTCASTRPCLKLHNGAVISYNTLSFAATGSGNYLDIMVDPDGVYSNTTNGPGKSIKFNLFFNGRLSTYGVQINDSSVDPTWFSW